MKLMIKSKKGELGTIEKKKDGTIIVESKKPGTEKDLKKIIKDIKSGPVSIVSKVGESKKKTKEGEVYKKIIERIIHELKYIIGDIAITQANVIDGLKLDSNGKVLTLEGDPPEILENLITRYEKIMGPVAIMLAKRAAQPIRLKEKNLKLPKKLSS